MGMRFCVLKKGGVRIRYSVPDVSDADLSHRRAVEPQVTTLSVTDSAFLRQSLSCM